jgi:carbamoyltransferase
LIVLGLSTFGENPSACLVRDGKLVAFCQEERLNRLKNSTGFFPSSAVNWCLRDQGLKLGDVDRIAVSWDCTKYPWQMFMHLAQVKFGLKDGGYQQRSSIQHGGGLVAAVEYLNKHTVGSFESGIRDHLRIEGHKGPIPKIEFVGHHLSHAYQTYYQSAFDEAGILVVDGSGEENCVSAYHAKSGNIRKVFGYDIPYSLGWFFGGFTAYLGFRANRDEGKLMGLAALGEVRRNSNPWIERLDKIVKPTRDGFEMDPTYFKFGGNELHPRYTDQLFKFVTTYDPGLVPIGVNERAQKNGATIHKYLLDEYVDLAFAVQTKLEEVLVSLTNRLVRETGAKKLCVAGGVAMNCKANGHVLDHAGLEDIFVHPASSDDGVAIGAAFIVSQRGGHDVRNVLEHAQWGPKFNNDAVREALDVSHVKFTTPPDICESVADLLAQGRMGGWFQGGVEMGARALGGRSIIAWPKQPGMKEKINRDVKFREEWRPYCPSMTAESAPLYSEDPREAPFMILARRATKKLMDEAPATVHVDGSIRPQTVRKEVLPRWYHLLESVGRRTGDPVLLNTSLNVRGEPIVCTPHDAIRCFFSNGMEFMAIEDCLLMK